MSTINNGINKIASLAVLFFSAVLFVSANTASSGLIYHPTAPDDLKRFSVIK